MPVQTYTYIHTMLHFQITIFHVRNVCNDPVHDDYIIFEVSFHETDGIGDSIQLIVGKNNCGIWKEWVTFEYTLA